MIKIQEILASLDVIEFIGQDDQLIDEIIQFDPINTRKNVLLWCNDKNIDNLKQCKAGTIICSMKMKELNLSNLNCNYIIVDNPRLAFSKILNAFFLPKKEMRVISKNTIIDPSVIIGANVFIGNFVVIEKGCVIGDNTTIGHNTVLRQKTVIGNNVVIGCNNTIGGVGFGYEKSSNGEYEVLPHIGNVIIKDNVEIGNNTCIDRAVLGSTILHENVKVDNLVHIAHGVVIDKNSLIIAHAMIGGSTKIGKNVWVAPNAALINKIIVEDGATIGLGAVVVKNVVKNEIVVGNPAKPLVKK